MINKMWLRGRVRGKKRGWEGELEGGREGGRDEWEQVERKERRMVQLLIISYS